MAMEGGVIVFDGSQILQELSKIGDEKLQALYNDAISASSTHEAVAAQCKSVALSLIQNAMCGLSLPSQLLEQTFVVVDFPSDPATPLDQGDFCSKIRALLVSIADALKEKPLVAKVLDGSSIKSLLEDEDDFAWLAENLFTQLDVEDTGKIRALMLRTALLQMGSNMGVPTPSDGEEAEKLISTVLERHKAMGDIGQAQFAKLLQDILEDLAECLALHPLAATLDLNANNSSEFKKVFSDADMFSKITNAIFDDADSSKDGKLSRSELRRALEIHAKEWGLPERETNDRISQLYDELFAASDVDQSGEIDKEEFQSLLKQILTVFYENVETNMST